MEKKYEVKYILKGIKKIKVIIADTKFSAISQITSIGGNVYEVKETKETFEEKTLIFLEVFKNKITKRKIKTQELVNIFKQLAVMVNAGMSLTDSLMESVSVTKNKRLKEIIEDAVAQIESGKNLNESLQKYEYELGTLTISMIKMGEESGELSEALYDLNKILQEMDENKRKIKKAMKQPIITIIVMMLAMVVLIVKVVPKFKSIFSNFGADLPVPTKILIFLSDSFQAYGLQIVIVIFIIIFSHIKITSINEKYKYKTDLIKYKLPIFGKIIKYGMITRFINVFNKLLGAGVPMSDALETATNIVDNAYMKKIFKKIQFELTQGGTLSEILYNTKLFQDMDIKMIKSGEESGELNSMLNHVSNKYKDEFDDIVDNLSSLIEPILLLFVAGMVLLLALGIFLPMWDLASAVKHG